jgi:dihydroxyacetone kinase-like predicted kinase
VATVAVAPGPGWADVFRSLGTSRVVPGGQTMNPSAQDILAAARRTRAPAVVVLPNNDNVVMTAQHAAGLAASGGAGGPRLVVVPTRTVPQGIAAQLAFNPEAGADANAAAMAAAAAGVRTVEITRATRSVTLQDRVVNQGDVLGLLDGELVAAGPDALAAARQALERAGAGGADLITVYRGAAVAAADADAFVAALRATYPSTEIELVSGGQPHYDYVISAE